MNKVLRCLRIFGWSWHIHEYSAKYEEDVDFQLIRLKVQVSEDREKYNYLINELPKLLAFGSLKSTGYIGQFSTTSSGFASFDHYINLEFPAVSQAAWKQNIVFILILSSL